MDFTELFGTQDQPAVTPQPTAGGMASVMQPIPDFTAAQRPAANPQELEQRMNGWARIQHRLEKDPHILNAIIAGSAAMMQGGQGPASAGRGLAAGMNAYTQGTEKDFQQRLLAAREGRAVSAERREEELHPSRVATAKASAEQTAAKTPIVQSEARRAIATEKDAIEQARLATQRARLALDEGQGEAAVAELERDIRAIRAFEAKGTAAQQVRTELEKAEESLKLLKAQTRTATSGAATAELTQKVFAGLPEAEQERLVKAKFTGHNPETGFVQQERIYRALYKGLPADDPQKKGMTEDQYVSRQLASGKAADSTKSLKDYIQAMDTAGQQPDPEIIQLYSDAIKMNAGARAGRAGAGRQVPPEAIQFLKKNPSTKAAFDQKYGAGAADRYLRTSQ